MTRSTSTPAFATSLTSALTSCTFTSTASSRTFIGTSVLPPRPSPQPQPSVEAPQPQHVGHRRVTPPSMFFNLGFSLPFQKKDTVDIPQNDTENADKRAADVEKSRDNYQWYQEGIGTASMIKGLPKGEFPSFGWLEEMAQVLLRVYINRMLNAGDEFLEGAERSAYDAIAGLLTPILGKLATGSFGSDDADGLVGSVDNLLNSIKGPPKGPANSIAEHKDMFKNIKLDMVAHLNQFLRDDVFGWYRVAGPNPMRITKLTVPVSDMFPEFTDAMLQDIGMFKGDSIANMQKEGRLYYVDYPELNGVETGKDVDGNIKPSYIYAPTCLMAVPINHTDRTTVLPLAIRCGQDRKKYPMYTASPSNTDEIAWLAAKLTVQVADSIMHEAVYHLGRTHLLVGIFICSTYRALPIQHPIHRLLKCHFYGTAFINNAAISALINPGGAIDKISAPDIYVTQQVAADSVNGEDFKFNEWFPDVELANRGVLDPSLKFPYRDDALALWPVVVDWVRDYVSTYYGSDADVQGDAELANWCREIVGPTQGNLHGFGETADGKILTREYLVRVVAMVIFTATIQHAAVNFPQGTMMQFAPTMPLGGYAPAPTTPKPFKNESEFVAKMMPDLDRSEEQLETAETIGVLVFNKFGEYGSSLEFAPDSVDAAMEEFQDRLGVVAAKIQERNHKERQVQLPVYKYLVPKNIPQSINV